MKRVAIYCRVSTQEQSEKGFSIPEQKERLVSYCKIQGWIISEIYIDPGYSGMNLDRPAIQRLLSEIKNFDIVLVWRLDRLSRRTYNTLHLIENIFKKNNIAFVSLTENIDTSTSQGMLYLQILASIAQSERETFQERSRLGKEGRAKRGLYHGGKIPVGYDYIDGQLIINEFEALQIREIFNLYLQGKGTRVIYRIMKERGYTYKNGLKWGCQNISLVLKNPLYAGIITYKGNSFQGQHVAIISEEIFLKTKGLKNERKKSKYFQSNSLLSGFIFCGNCGARYYNCIWKKKYKYYTCYSRGKPMEYMIKNPNCKNKTWRMEELDRAIESEIFRLCKDVKYFKKVSRKPKKDNKREIIEKKIKQIDKQIDKLLDLYQFEETTGVKKIGERISNLHKEKEDLLENLPPEEVKKEDVKEKMSFIKTIPEMWKNADLTGKRFILEKLIKKVVLIRQGYEIQWKL